MLFKKPKRKQLENMRCKVSMLRTSMEVRKKLVLARAKSYTDSKEDFLVIIEQAYDYMIKELTEIEELK